MSSHKNARIVTTLPYSATLRTAVFANGLPRNTYTVVLNHERTIAVESVARDVVRHAFNQ